MNQQNLDHFGELDMDTPSTSNMHDVCLITQPDEDLDINIMDSDDDVSLALRQTETRVNSISKPIVSKRANEEFLGCQLTNKKTKKIGLLKQLVAIRRARRARGFYIETDNSDDEEIDVVNLPATKIEQVECYMLECKLQMKNRYSYYRKLRNEVMQKLMSPRNYQEEEHIDVVNDTPLASNRQLRKKVKYLQNQNIMEERRKSDRNQDEDEEIDVVNVSSSSEASAIFSPNLNTRQSNSLHRRVQTRSIRATIVTTPPPLLTIDLSNREADNSEIIEINDSTIHSNSDVIVVDDTSDELSPVKGSPKSRRFGLGDCPVCLEDLSNKEIMSTICGHVFCSPCIKSAIKTNKKCPNCRKTLTLKSIHPLFI